MNDSTPKLNIIRLKGKYILPYIEHLAKLRLGIFKDYPYLYAGDLEYEMHYLETYIKCPESVMVIALDGNQVVGASTSMPLEFEDRVFQTPFLTAGMKIQDIFYLGESVLQPAYRGQGTYKYFFKEREAAAREYGAQYTAFCAVERPLNHPQKPENYIPLDAVWNRFGYQKHPKLHTQFKWKEIGEENASPKTMVFWLKKI